MEPAAVLVRAFQIHIGRPGHLRIRCSGWVENGKMRGARIEPDVEDVVLFAPFLAAASANCAFGKQFLGGMRVPRIRSFALEPANHLAQRPNILQPGAAFVAIEDHQRHAPHALPRNTPVWAMRDHLVNAFAAPFRRPFHFRDFVQRQLPQRLGLRGGNRGAPIVELNEPLLGGPEDHRIVAAPAVRIAVLQLALGHKCSARFQQFDDRWIGFKNGLAVVFRQSFGEAAVIVEWRVSFQPIFLTDGEVLGSVPRRGVHDSRALLQGNVLAQDPGNHAIQERMLEFAASEIAAWEGLGYGRKAQACLFANAFHELLRQEIGVAPLVLGEYVFMLRMERQSHACRKRPWRGRPHQGVNAVMGAVRWPLSRFQYAVSYPNGRTYVVFVLHFGFRQCRPVMNAPIHRLQAAEHVSLL